MSICVRLLNRELAMEKEFLNKMEDNVVVRVWLEKTQLEKGDSLTEGNYVDLPYLLNIKVDKYLFRALAQFYNFAYSCFTFGKVDLVPTVEEYTTLLHCPRIQADKAYSRAVNVPTFVKKLMNIKRMSEQWVAAWIKQKGENFFDRLDRKVTPVLVILAETFRSLNACRRTGEERFICCAQLLLAWFHSHFWKVENVFYRVFSENYSLLKELLATPRRDGITEERWMMIFQNLQEEDCEFSYNGDNYKKNIREVCNAWNQTRRMERFAIGPMTTPEYYGWSNKRVNDNIPGLSQEGVRPMEEYLLDVDVQKLETEKLRKGKNKVEEDLDSLKINYKKLRLSMKTTGMGKTSEQWRQKIRQEKNKKQRSLYGRSRAQILEVANYLQTLAVQVDKLSVKYELESDQGQELASLLRKIKVLSIRAK
ncbi:hypothetical protein Goklo_004415, partial [Gossypium klotzschianum]|nr:hypothetical protein [Gossypium klotzschianum]